MRTIAAMCAVLMLGCGSKGGGRYEIKRKLDNKGTRSIGLPHGEQSYLEAKPKLSIVGVTGEIEKGMRARLEADPLAKLGSVDVTIDVKPISPKAGSGHVEATIKLEATFLAAPELIAIDNTITATIDYSGTSLAKLGEELGDIVGDDLAGEKLPPTIGFPTAPPAKVVAVTTGSPSCTLHEDGSVRCWAWKSTPVLVPKAGDAIAVDAAQNYGACVLKRDGTVHCIDAWSASSNLEVKKVCGVEHATAISVGANTACAAQADGKVKCWAGQPASFEPCEKPAAVEVENVTDAVALYAGPFEGCALGKDGTVKCWEHCGKDCKSTAKGEVDGPPKAAIAKGLPKKATAVAMEFGACVVHDKTKVTCVDIDDTKKKPIVTVVPDEITNLAANMGLCALGAKGTIYCWNTDKPAVPLASPTDVAYLSGELAGYCAITRANDVLCWGGMDETPPEKAKKLELF